MAYKIGVGAIQYMLQLYRMTTQDMLTIAVLVTVVLVALLFPGGPGTPRRFRVDLGRDLPPA